MIVNRKITPGTEQSVPSNTLGLFPGTDDIFYIKKPNGDLIPLLGGSNSNTLQQVVNNGNELNGLIINTGSVAIDYTPEPTLENLFIQGNLSFLNESPYPNRGSVNIHQMIDPLNPSYSVGMAWVISETEVLGPGTSSFIPTIGMFHFRGPATEDDTETPSIGRYFTINPDNLSILQFYDEPSTGENESALIGMTRALDFLGNTASIVTINTQKNYGTYSWISRNDVVSGSLIFNNMEVSQFDENGNTIVRNRVWVDKEKVQIETGEFQMNNKVGFTGTFSSSGLWEFENGILISFTDV